MTTIAKLFQWQAGTRRTHAARRAISVVVRMLLACSVIVAPLPRATAGDWIGYMNVFNNNAGSQGGFVFGSGWGIPDLKTTVLARPGTGINVENNILELFPNFNTYANSLSGNNADRAFWTNSTDGGATPGPSGNKWMEALTFVEEPGLARDSVTFSGRIDSYTLSGDYAAQAFIKVLDPAAGYTAVYNDSLNLAGLSDFSLTAEGLVLYSGLLLQMGVSVSGINANPAAAASLGSVRITTNPSPAPPPIEWLGFMNVSEKTAGGGQGASLFSSNWGVADLKTTLISVDPTTLADNQLALFPNFNTYANAVTSGDSIDIAYWTNSTDGGVTPGPQGNKWMDANTFVENSIVDQTSTSFNGRIDAYTLSPEYAAEAFIRVLDPANNYSQSLFESRNLSGATDFTLSADLSSFAGQILQRGFRVNGVNANPVDASALGSVLVTVMPSTGPAAVTIDVASGSQTQSQAGYPTIPSATSVTKVGAGTLVFDAANAYSGPTTVAAGTLQVADAGAVAASPVTVASGATLAVAAGVTMKAPSVTVSGGTLSAGTLTVDAATGVATLTINSGTIAPSSALVVGAGGLVDLPDAARLSLGVASLAVTETSGGGKIDLGAGQLTVAAGGISGANLRADIIAGRNGGAWNGAAGITSAAAASSGGTRAVGYVVAGDGSARASFAAPGDTDLSGQVNVFDLVSIDSAGRYGNGQAAVWSEGDFNYDGFANIFDLVSIDTGGAYGAGNYFPTAPAAAGLAGSVAAVPEPTGVGLLAAAALAGLALRRRR